MDEHDQRVPGRVPKLALQRWEDVSAYLEQFLKQLTDANDGVQETLPVVSLIDHTHRLTILTTKGDLLGHNGTDAVRVPIAAAGYVPTADPAAAVGWSWQPSSGTPPTPTAPDSRDQEQADFEARAAFDSLALRSIIARTFR